MTPALLVFAQWIIRSCALIAAAKLAIWIARTKSPHAKLTTWTIVLVAILSMPILSEFAVRDHLSVPISVSSSVPALFNGPFPASNPLQAVSSFLSAHAGTAVVLWAIVAACMLLRIAVGLVLTRRLMGKTTLVHEGVRESGLVAVPLTTGLWRPTILLPACWRSWDARKLAAVLAHERSHAHRRDALLRLAAAVYRSVAWFNPLSWWLYAELSHLMEVLADEAGVKAVADRGLYAEIVVGFFRETRVRSGAMAIAQRALRARRIDCILECDFGLSQKHPFRQRVLQSSLVALAIMASLPFRNAGTPYALANLSGSWELNLSRSIFHNPQPPKNCRLTIQQGASRIQLAFDFVRTNGDSRHLILRLEQGKPSERTSFGVPIVQTADWRGGSVVIFEKSALIASERILSASSDHHTLRSQTIYRFAGKTIEDSEVYDKLQ